MNWLYFLISILAFVFSIILGLNIYESISISAFIYLLIKFIIEFNTTVWSFMDIPVILALFMWLVMPMFSYHFFNEQNKLAILWDRVMRVDSLTYFSFILPATLAFIVGLKFQFSKQNELTFNIHQLGAKFRTVAYSRLGYQLIGLSLMASIFKSFLPSFLSFVVFLLVKLSFVGLFYLYFSAQKRNPFVLLFGILVLLVLSIREGMFGELIFMTVLGAILVTQGVQISFFTKFLVVVVGLFTIILLQSVKAEYRSKAWKTGGSVEYFVEVVSNRLQNPHNILTEENLFSLNYRFNQGWLIAATMNRVPSVVPHANGETIWLSLLASVTPRFLWPDKPQSGGALNLSRFLGFKLTSTSMNISPIGEAWANFGFVGGILFMFIYGFSIKAAFNYVIGIINRQPTLLYWLPLLFLYVVVVETDVLTVYNYLIKTGFFIYMINKVLYIFTRQTI